MSEDEARALVELWALECKAEALNFHRFHADKEEDNTNQPETQ